MDIINQLNKLPVNDGEYLVLPKKEKPFFIIPLQSKDFFIKSVAYIKPKNKYGLIKKIFLSIIPISILKILFCTIKISTKINKKYPQLILPWNQDFCKKFVIFNIKEKPTLIKIGFSEAKNLINNEYKIIQNISKINSKIVPKILNYEVTQNYSFLEINFYNGKHPDQLPNTIHDFFSCINKEVKYVKFIDHPYINRMVSLVYNSLDKKQHGSVIGQISFYLEKYKNISVSVNLMHGDFTKTNIIVDKKRAIITDWEECILDGIPIDIKYFDFRNKIDNNQVWKIIDEIDFLVVFHYIYFQCLYSKNTIINSLLWQHDIVQIKR